MSRTLGANIIAESKAFINNFFCFLANKVSASHFGLDQHDEVLSTTPMPRKKIKVKRSITNIINLNENPPKVRLHATLHKLTTTSNDKEWHSQWNQSTRKLFLNIQMKQHIPLTKKNLTKSRVKSVAWSNKNLTLRQYRIAPIDRPLETIIPTKLLSAVKNKARLDGKNNISIEAGIYTTKGFKDFDDKIFSENPAVLLKHFNAELITWDINKTQEWTLQLEPSIRAKLRLTAKEYGKPASEFAAMCLAHGLAITK